MEDKKSKFLFEESKKYIPGGVNSPVRAFNAVGGVPLYIERAAGSKIFDVDGNEYIDYVGSWGPMIVGHCNPRVREALTKVIEKGTSFGAPTELELKLAEMVIEAVPSIELVRMVNSGTEAAMSAIRLARGYTGRDKVIKFEGGYHGHADGLLVKAGSGATTLGVPDSPGIPADYARNTITVPFNNLEAVDRALENEKGSLACIIVEPLPGNMGVVPPAEGFLDGLRKLCSDNDVILIFDEVMSGFRVAYGGAQELFGVTPDLTCLGKVIGGGLPVGAYGGKKEIMEIVAPSGPVYQAGTLSGNPLAMAAGIETLNILSEEGVYERLEKTGSMLAEGMKDLSYNAGIRTYSTRAGSMFCLFFNDNEVVDYSSAKKSDTEMFSRFFHRMLDEGVNMAPSQFEAGFVSLAHTEADIEQTLLAAKKSFDFLK